MVKDNQRPLKQEIADLWEWEPLPNPQATQTGSHGGRVEARRLWASDALEGCRDWPHLAQVCRIERIVARRGETSQGVAYAVTSLPAVAASPYQLLNIWRGHCGIENRVHWVRDVSMDEDRCRVSTSAAPQVLAALRNLVISLLRRAGTSNLAAALRRHAAHPPEALTLVGISYTA